MDAVELRLPGWDPPPSQDLWALDLEAYGPFGATAVPVLAHKVVRLEGAGIREVRITACGQRRTYHTHPRGWWTTLPGKLPLQPQHIHCGLEEAPHVP
jgi:hypothetical protein